MAEVSVPESDKGFHRLSASGRGQRWGRCSHGQRPDSQGGWLQLLTREKAHRRETGWFEIAFLFNWALLCLYVMTDCSAGIPGSSMERFFISHWTMSAPGIQRRALVRSGVTAAQFCNSFDKKLQSTNTNEPWGSLCVSFWAVGQSCQSWASV